MRAIKVYQGLALNQSIEDTQLSDLIRQYAMEYLRERFQHYVHVHRRQNLAKGTSLASLIGR